MISLKEAQQRRVCRICECGIGPRRRLDGTIEAWILDYGKEFSHEDCLKNALPIGNPQDSRTAAKLADAIKNDSQRGSAFWEALAELQRRAEAGEKP